MKASMKKRKLALSAAAKRRAKQFQVTHAANAEFGISGLRGYFGYRDLGIKRATRGRVVSHVIRARPGRASHPEWHWHDCQGQFVYMLKGWAKFEYEGVGEVRMEQGSCFYQPPRIRHREIGHSENLEMLEVVWPANFKTYTAKDLG